MSSEVNVDDKLKKILEKYVDTKSSKFTDDASLIDLGMDSLDVVELCMELEEEFNFEIPYEDEEKIKQEATFSTLKDLILRYFNEEVVPTTT